MKIIGAINSINADFGCNKYPQTDYNEASLGKTFTWSLFDFIISYDPLPPVMDTLYDNSDNVYNNINNSWTWICLFIQIWLVNHWLQNKICY